MLGFLSALGLGVGALNSSLSIDKAEKEARKRALREGRKFWTNHKGQQIDTITGKVLTVEQVVGYPPSREVKKKQPYWAVYSHDYSYSDIMSGNANPIEYFKTKEDAENFTKELEGNDGTIGYLCKYIYEYEYK